MIPLPSRLPWLFVYPCQRQNPSRSTNRISKAFCWCHGEFGPSTRSVSVPNPNTTKHAVHRNHVFESNQNILVFLGKSNITGICLLRTKKQKEIKQQTTSLPYRMTCHARPGDRDLRPRKWSLSRYDARWILQESSSTHTKYSPKKSKKDLGKKNGDVHSVYTYIAI